MLRRMEVKGSDYLRPFATMQEIIAVAAATEAVAPGRAHAAGPKCVLQVLLPDERGKLCWIFRCCPLSS